MRRNRFRFICLLAICLLAAGLVTVVIALAVRRIADVAAIQNSVARDWEITFNEGGRPRILPAYPEAKAEDLLYRLIGPEHDPLLPGERANRTEVWHERFRSLFRGRITAIEIH